MSGEQVTVVIATVNPGCSVQVYDREGGRERGRGGREEGEGGEGERERNNERERAAGRERILLDIVASPVDRPA